MHGSKNRTQGGGNNITTDTGNKPSRTRQPNEAVKEQKHKMDKKKLQQTQERGRQLHQRHSHTKTMLYMHDIKMSKR